MAGPHSCLLLATGLPKVGFGAPVVLQMILSDSHSLPCSRQLAFGLRRQATSYQLRPRLGSPACGSQRTPRVGSKQEHQVIGVQTNSVLSIETHSCIKMLIHHYPQPDHVNWADSRGWTALIEACSNGYLPIVNFLLEKGARPELTDETKRTALHIAALRGHVEVCGCLLAVMPALLDATDYFQASALLLALDQQRLPVVELLMMRKPALNKADKEGYTIAHVAALTGAISLLRTLAVADHELLEAMDHRGRTPLLLACQRGQIEVRFESGG